MRASVVDAGRPRSPFLIACVVAGAVLLLFVLLPPLSMFWRAGAGFLGEAMRQDDVRRSLISPMIPLGAMMTQSTISRPTISRLTEDEMVTVATCCSVPSRMAPISGPSQLVVPPIIGIAIELTA